jgi:hypothetical protein
MAIQYLRNCSLLVKSNRCFWLNKAHLSLSSLENKHRLTTAGAVKLVKELSAEDRALLISALQKKEEQVALKNGGPTVPPPSMPDLYKLAMHQSLPFIGFGFLDNLIMIVAGEYIDASIGASLAISTMAAAALGNTLSDVFGVGSAWYVESLATKMGVNPPVLSVQQLELTSCRIAANGGRAIGVAIGCILGMFPLLFYKGGDKKEEGTNKHEKKGSVTPHENK